MERINPERALSIVRRNELNASSAAVARSPATAEALTALWLAATGTWSGKWTAKHGDLPMDDDGCLTVCGLLWARGLAGFDERHMLAALDFFIQRGDDWPPDLPEFRKQCFGIPPFYEVSAELVTPEPPEGRSRFAILTGSFIDWHAHRHAGRDGAVAIRREAYQRACAHVLRGEPLPPAPKRRIAYNANPPPRNIPKTREARTAHLQKLLGEDFNPRTVASAPEDARL